MPLTAIIDGAPGTQGNPRVTNSSSDSKNKRKKKDITVVSLSDPHGLIPGRTTASTYITYDSGLGRFKVVNH